MRAIIPTLVVLAIHLAVGRADAQAPLQETAAAADALRQERFAEAEALWTEIFERATGEARSSAAFFAAFSAYKQGEELIRANPPGDPQVAARAMEHLVRALTLLEQTEHPQAGQVEAAVVQYIAPDGTIQRDP